MMRKLVGISLAIIMVLGFTQLGYSESLRVQLEQGIQTSETECQNPDHMLVQRTNGNVACVTEKLAQKTGWKIIISLEPIPNPTSYWLPIQEEDKDELAKKFVNATGDSLTGEVNKYGYYITEYGKISNSFTTYRLYDLNLDFKEQKKFTKDFMDSMGFEYNKEDLGYTSKYYGNTFYYSHEFSKIEFEFNDRYDNELTITFDGWTNNPELIVFPLSEELALAKALALTDDLYSSGDCGLETHQYENIKKLIIDDVPFYEIDLGACHGEFILGGLVWCGVSVSINAMNQTDSSVNVWCGDG